uniref:Uncharacterized protein n=1 Tax=Oryza brachyantha TaxID=4533 RepID=J3L4X8_ORYBR
MAKKSMGALAAADLEEKRVLMYIVDVQGDKRIYWKLFRNSFEKQTLHPILIVDNLNFHLAIGSFFRLLQLLQFLMDGWDWILAQIQLLHSVLPWKLLRQSFGMDPWEFWNLKNLQWELRQLQRSWQS